MRREVLKARQHIAQGEPIGVTLGYLLPIIDVLSQ